MAFSDKNKDADVEKDAEKLVREEARKKALEKMGVYEPEPKKKTDKISGRKKSFPKRFIEAALPMPQDDIKEKIRKIVLIVMIAVLAVSVFILVEQLTSIEETAKRNDELADIAGVPLGKDEIDMIPNTYKPPTQVDNPIMTEVTQPGTEEPEYIDLTPVVNKPLNVGWEKLQEINEDIRAWIKITGTTLNNPVVQSDDNDFYLKHNFDKNKSTSGTIFSSYANKWDGTDGNIILFGHNVGDGSMLDYIVHYIPNDRSYEPLAFYKVHPTVLMSTPAGGEQTYKIFAGICVNTQSEYGEPFSYAGKTSFYGKDDFNNFILEIMDRSWFFTDVDIDYGDEILTLSTCWWPLERSVDTRWVLFARRTRPGESTEVNTENAVRNYNAKMFDYYYKRRGGSWKGRTWDTSKLLSYGDRPVVDPPQSSPESSSSSSSSTPPESSSSSISSSSSSSEPPESSSSAESSSSSSSEPPESSSSAESSSSSSSEPPESSSSAESSSSSSSEPPESSSSAESSSSSSSEPPESSSSAESSSSSSSEPPESSSSAESSSAENTEPAASENTAA